MGVWNVQLRGWTKWPQWKNGTELSNSIAKTATPQRILFKLSCWKSPLLQVSHGIIDQSREYRAIRKDRANVNLTKQLKLSEYSGIYDVVVPKDHILRRRAEQIDFSFVNVQMVDSYSIEFGRPAKEPELMLKLLFLKLMYDLSDRGVMRREKMPDMNQRWLKR